MKHYIVSLGAVIVGFTENEGHAGLIAAALGGDVESADGPPPSNAEVGGKLPSALTRVEPANSQGERALKLRLLAPARGASNPMIRSKPRAQLRSVAGGAR